MIKLSKFGIVLCSVLLSVSAILACGYYLEYPFSLFIPEIIEKKQQEKFFYSNNTTLYTGRVENHISAFNEQNILEWESYFNKKISKQTIEFWLYKSNLNQIDEMIFFIRDKKALQDKTLENSNISKSVPKEESIPFLFYLGFALRNEKLTTKPIFSWEEEPKKESTDEIKKQIEGGLKLFVNEKNTFLKERYIFQLVRLYYFNKEYSETIQFYEKNKSEFKTKNSMELRTLSYFAGALKKNKEFSKANYLFSKIFTESKIMQEIAFVSFEIKDDKDWNKTLELAKNLNEKINLWYLFGLKLDGTKAIKEISKLNPDSEFLDVLLTREINKNEHYFLGYDPKYYDTKKMKKDMEELANIITNLTIKKNNFAWNISASYLNFYIGKVKIADEFLNKSKSQINSKELNQAQYYLTHLYGKIVSNEKISLELEEEILPDIEFIFSKKTEKIPSIRIDYAKFNWVRSELARKFLKQNEFEKAELINAGIIENHFAKLENTDKMIKFLDKKNPTKLEKFFITNSQISKKEYIRLLALQFIYKDDLDSALKTLKQIPQKEISKVPTDPFQIRKIDTVEKDILKSSKYNEISLIEKMIELKKQISEKKNVSENYFLLANAFYNISYFGTSRLYQNSVQNYYNFWDDSIKYTKPDKNHFKELDNLIALKYYILAEENSKDKEFKAKSIFMSAKCEQNETFLKGLKENEDFKAGFHFKNLKENFSQTNYYKEIIQECGYFRKYVGK